MKSHQLLFTSLLFGRISVIMAIGLSITPVIAGDPKYRSSLSNLMNCITYTTSKDDIILLTTYSGNKLRSQELILRIFDSDDNTLRSMQDLKGDQSFIFTNLNNPIQITQPDPDEKIGLAARRHLQDIQTDSTASSKSEIHICFDNIYFDKSWSFQKQIRDVQIKVNIRNITTLKSTDYNDFAKYFVRISDRATDENLDVVPDKGDRSGESDSDFTESDFEKAVVALQTSLNEVSEELRSSEETLLTLKTLEAELRNANETIYDSFTRTSLAIIAAICFSGAAQLVYIYIFLKRRRLI